MKKPVLTVRKAYFPYLYKDEEKGHNKSYGCYMRAFYMDTWGEVVSIFANWDHPERNDETNFEFRYQGKEYIKTYPRTFSDRGLMKVAAAFIYFINTNYGE